ncbi:2-hydroxyacid dehydrogenase [Aliihoeflea aestuarii]|uniref:2-hydroxyacid dehydrogenase n=1 Tax=Aliihoeflea aestuarii TaxID=453840 RepID=UPI0020928B13|nr:2-hydroxyacid dehydrogenase [Aliihoeflea aestuarii]MCO6391870.1 2-hydroxyacid dehydrogenase [Aliihoeflea aestuarii]
MPENDLKSVTLLIRGKLHPHAAARLEETFTIVRGGEGDALAGEHARKIKAVAAAATVDPALIDTLPQLEIVSSFGVGYDHVDAAYAATRNVVVTNTPDVLTDEVADTAIGLLINAVRELPKAEQWLRDGLWVSEGAYRLTNGTLRGRRVGIFGMGRIGLAIAKRIEAFGLPVSYHNRRPVEGVSYAYFDSLVELAANVDTLISVAPSTPQTQKIVDAEILKALGPTGVFVNIGRGNTVDEDALAAALHDGTIQAAGLDVFYDEPNVPQALIDAPNASLLPHVGSATIHTREAMADLVVDNLIAWFSRGEALTPVAETIALAKRK